ncbi:hypothetical protein LCGC14_0818550 [marine sediment metagenome]|uniref:Uncharacterized protein n=1 Tax=marine sediment metagenome TaxID=412755 RepID=A0A0F9PJH3_9ZZZZ
MDTIIFSFLSRKEEFLQFLPEKNKTLFNFLNIFDFLQKFELPPLEQADFYKIILKMLKSKYIAKRKGHFIFVSKNIDAYLLSVSSGLKIKTLAEKKKKKKEDESQVKKLKEQALAILRGKARKFPFIDSEVIDKSKELIKEFEAVGSFPKINAYVAFYQANRILNKTYYKNKLLFTFSNKEHVKVRYTKEKFEKAYFDNLYDIDKARTFLLSIKEIGDYKLTKEFRELVLVILDSPIKYRFGLNVFLTLGLSILLVANLWGISIDDRDVSKILQIDISELIVNSFKLMESLTSFKIKGLYKKNVRFTDFINSNLIRIGDHLTFDLNSSPSEDAEVIGYKLLKYRKEKLTHRDWAIKLMGIEKASFATHRYIFHRETRLALKTLGELITPIEVLKKREYKKRN